MITKVRHLICLECGKIAIKTGKKNRYCEPCKNKRFKKYVEKMRKTREKLKKQKGGKK